MTYAIFFFIFVSSLLAFFYSYYVIDHKNKEPKRAFIFSILFSGIIFFGEFFLLKPSIGKFISFSDTYMFIYFLTEEKSHLESLSISQNIIILILACLSKAIAYAIGLKILFTILYRLGKKKWFAGKHYSHYGFIDEPIDYVLYASSFFITLSFLDSTTQFRFDQTFSIEKVSAIYLLFSYVTLGIIMGLSWLRLKVHFKKNHTTESVIASWMNKKISNKKLFGGLISTIELQSIITLFFLLLLIRAPLVFNSVTIEIAASIIVFIVLIQLLKHLKRLKSSNYEILTED